MFENKVYLPQGCVEGVIRDYHDDLLQGHLGIAKTLEIIERTYARPKIRKEVENYIKSCVLC